MAANAEAAIVRGKLQVLQNPPTRTKSISRRRNDDKKGRGREKETLLHRIKRTLESLFEERPHHSFPGAQRT